MAKIRVRKAEEKPAQIKVIDNGETDRPTAVSPRDLAKRLLEKHESVGIKQPKAAEYPELPEDITEISSKDLSALYGKLDAFGSFVGFHLAVEEVYVLDCQNQHSDAMSKAMLDELELKSNKKVTVSQLKAAVRLDDNLRQLNTDLVFHQAQVILLKERLSAIERSIRVLSREQSRREAEREHRDK